MTESLWNRLHKKLELLAEERHCQNIPIVKLAIGVIISAGREKDMLYLRSDQFLYHCYIAGMDSVYVGKMIETAWYYLDNNIPVLPEPQEENDNDNTETE